MGAAVQQFVSGLFGCQRKRGKGIHDQIDPKHLDRLQHLFLKQGSTNEGYAHCHHVYSQLELHKLPN